MKMLSDDRYIHLHGVIAAGKENLLKWYRNMDDSEISMGKVLHPSIQSTPKVKLSQTSTLATR
jgi:hypothetical protein